MQPPAQVWALHAHAPPSKLKALTPSHSGRVLVAADAASGLAVSCGKDSSLKVCGGVCVMCVCAHVFVSSCVGGDGEGGSCGRGCVFWRSV